MVYLTKTAVGFALVLLGGIGVAHGTAVGLLWEMIGGLILLLLGICILALKVLRRTRPRLGQQTR